MNTVVMIREPMPPHAPIFNLLPADGSLSYGFMLMQQQTASFRLSRADANWPTFTDLLHPDSQPPMVTIERSDGLHPWVGFVKTFEASYADPEVKLFCADHMWRLANARTQITGSADGSSGDVIVSTIREMEQRGEPALYLLLDAIEAGPAVTYEYRAQRGTDFLRQMADFTGWEWHLFSRVGKAVDTWLRWAERVGVDRREAVVLEENIHLADVRYVRDYEAGISASLVVGGSGAFSTRQYAVANQNGRDDTANATPVKAPITRGLGGTRRIIDPQMSGSLVNAAMRMHDTPDYATEQISFTLAEASVDMALINVGDTVTVRLATTDLGLPLERAVRLTAINFDPDTKLHQVQTQVVR